MMEFKWFKCDPKMLYPKIPPVFTALYSMYFYCNASRGLV